MELENLFENFSISKKKISNINFTKEVFRYIIAFSLAITKPNYDIAFSSKQVMEIYEKIKYYYTLHNFDFGDINNINKFLFLPCLSSMNEICFCLDNFQNSFGYKNYIANNNISKTYFKDMTNYIIDCFNIPCCESFYSNWSQEQINILIFIIEYININWFDIGEVSGVIDCEKFDFFFYDCQICTE